MCSQPANCEHCYDARLKPANRKMVQDDAKFRGQLQILYDDREMLKIHSNKQKKISPYYLKVTLKNVCVYMSPFCPLTLVINKTVMVYYIF